MNNLRFGLQKINSLRRAGKLDALDTVPAPSSLAQRLNWTLLTTRIDSLRRFRGTFDLAPAPDASDFRAQLFWHLCDPQNIDVLKVIASGELAELAGTEAI
jgi:hypothetical protein